MRGRTLALTLAAMSAGCDVGSVTDGDDPGLPGSSLVVVTSPRHGEVGRRTPIAIEGVTLGDSSVVPFDRVALEYWDADAGAWRELRQAEVRWSEPELGPRTGLFHGTLERDDVWADGGLLHLRVRAPDATVRALVPEAVCAAGGDGWRALAERCGVPDGPTLVDPAAPPDTIRLLDAKGAGSPEETAAYYAAIDAPATLAAFISRFGLDAKGIGPVVYYNAGDLGIGREMHCGSFAAARGTGVACYVRNYGEFGGDAFEALRLAINGAGGAGGAFATVAMVYQPPLDQPNSVQFMVYGADGALVLEAPLDTRGDNASIPHNCLNCHGSDSRYDAGAHAVLDAQFLPFDVGAFRFAATGEHSQGRQQAAVRALNELIGRTAPPPALAELMAGWYEVSPTQPDPAWTPPSWSAPTDRLVYQQLVAPSCRGCHASRDDLLDLADPALVRERAALVAQVVCRPDTVPHGMPNAEVTLASFWAGAGRAYLATLVGPELAGACTARVASR